ncbi:N-6 DNA methylase [Adlercreutzia sp. ZJ304]|uniref:N-6 DNA methylase n=1 Tax=Adlercreutzia sp. ZJ304 TaxID=2709791 RepID=UPI0013EA4B40|nr:N-6 DNA methylase [Adlercreutzia sp. ZJ304]
MDMKDYELRAELDYEAARDFFTQASHDIQDRSKEDPLRYLFCTRLPTMFPSKPWWIDEHARRAEANETYSVDNTQRSGFADVLIGHTAVEYEKNLAQSSIFDHGYEQVEDYCAGLLNKNVDRDNIVGILSDTVHWYAYRVDIEYDGRPTAENGLWGRDDLKLCEIDRLDMTDTSDENLGRFEKFINKYYGRIGSKELTPKALVSDFGLYSGSTKTRTDAIRDLVATACKKNPGYAKLVEGLWSNFVEGVTGVGSGFTEDYSHELYIITLAKLIAANILDGGAPERSAGQIREILEGSYFVSLGIENLVEYDYFGWLNADPYIDDLIDCAIELQRDLMVYDFANVATTDLFGGLISQMAGVDKKILLGQAPTPQPIAARMVSKVIENLNGRAPHLVDMCCGSGIFIVETLSQLIDNMGNPASLEDTELIMLSESIYGFDVDPLAVILSKVNWVLVMKKYLGFFAGPVHIPVYHADSLFTRTPVSTHDDTSSNELVAHLHDRSVSIPQFLISRPYRQLFDEMMVKADVVAADYSKKEQEVDTADTDGIFASLVTHMGMELDENNYHSAAATFATLIRVLSDLRNRDRNGIWPFVLSNSFKPAFATSFFNGIVSNPPWLALSRLRGNPYHDALIKLANSHGIMPHGSSFPHVELATIFLVASIRRYVSDDGVIACIMPHSMLNGRHEESFRTGGYLRSELTTEFKLTEIWELPKEAFNNRAAVIFAKKEHTDTASREVAGIVFDSSLDETQVTYKLITNGKATAFSYSTQNVEKALDAVNFNQGFDGMPRTAVIFKCEQQQNHLWTVSSIPANGDSLSFAIKDGKKCKNFSIGTVANIDGSLLYEMITSNQVMPFAPVQPVRAFLPVKYVPGQGAVELSDRDLALLGRSNKVLADKVKHCTEGGVEFYQEKGGYLAYLDTRNKLSHTLHDTSKWRVLYGAGGSNISASAVNCEEISRAHKLAIDQTLYWRGANSEDEALYYVGLLNSDAINDAIKEFQPEGNFGKRHIHTLPLSLISEYDPNDERHAKVVEATKLLQARIKRACAEDPRLASCLDPANGALSSRRRRFQQFYRTLQEFERLNVACMEAI